MNLLPLDQLGSHELPGQQVFFGLLLPWVSAADGNRISVKIIKEEDQFIQSILPKSFPLVKGTLAGYGDYWSTTITISTNDRPSANSQWGNPGRYVYRYELESPLLAEPLDWITDPFSREFGMGRQSAITLGYQEYAWGNIEQTWKTPALKDLIVYEIMLEEFTPGIVEATAKLPYLQDLGINCIEIMPVSNTYRSVDWGFEPIGHFGVDERFGKRKDFQAFIEAAHQLGIAVVLDMIYGHTGDAFAYEYVYANLKYTKNPFMGSFAQDMFGPSTDYKEQLTRDFFFTVNYFWLDRYHVDGIRYDCVPNYYDGFAGIGYANLVYSTYQQIKSTNGTGHWQRFFNQGRQLTLIQCAEQLEAPVEVVQMTYSNCTWQNGTLDAAYQVADSAFGHIYDLGMALGLSGYPDQVTANGDVMDKSVFQYLENHDHSRFICAFGTYSLYDNVIREGQRLENWFKVQPYIIALLLAKGIPLLWQGQEILESYDVPDSGPARIGTLRPVRWEYFYTNEGQAILGLFRKVIALRKNNELFRSGTYYFYNDWAAYQSKGILLFSRSLGNKFALVALNFSGIDQAINFIFPQAGNYTEQLHGQDNHSNITINQQATLTIPGNYGKVWIN